MFTLAQLSEGLQHTVATQGNRKMVEKWASTSLLKGLGPSGQEKMARLLENQAVEVLRSHQQGLLSEANVLSTGGAGLTSSGQVAGFTNVAFPIVRRVFAGLLANELISVQPMSLPSGLLFYLDYTYGNYVGGDAGTAANNFAANSDPGGATFSKGQSIYNNPTGKNVRLGSDAAGGQYNLIGTNYSKVNKRALNLVVATSSVGYWLSGSTWVTASVAEPTLGVVRSVDDFVGYNARFVHHDPTVENLLQNNSVDYLFMHISASEITSKITGADILSGEGLSAITVVGAGGTPGGVTTWPSTIQGGEGVLNLRQATKRGTWNDVTGIFVPSEEGSHIQMVLAVSNTGNRPVLGNAVANALTASAVLSDTLSANSDGSVLTIPSFETDFALDSSPRIPDVDIKIESVAVTATTRKLRARWSPEMAQDLQAYFTVDVEAELTNILSEMITLDVDREILNDLLTQASAANYFWSRSPGKFVNKVTGQEISRSSSLAPGPAFTGTVREWYETLMETITDAANVIYKKTLRGSGNFIVCGPEVATILEHTTAYRASVKIDGDGQVKEGMSIGAEAVGTLNNRYTVFKDPYFPTSRILIGFKGSNFLESGYIYAPYVPLILTPVIYAQEDFTPRKGIMTRYGKKMVRSDFFATVTVMDLSVI